MKIARLALTAALAAAASGAAAQSAGEELLKKNGCTACHAIDTKVIGPAYRDVAAKYRGDAAAAAKLPAKVKAGGAGAWGAMAMPPNPQVPDGELAQIIGYILSLK
jgi:cytochrome c